MKKTLEWNAPERTVVDSISVLTHGLESLIMRIGGLDARGAANSGAMKALDGGVRLPLRDVVDDSLEWVGDINESLAGDDVGLGSQEIHQSVVADCYAARSELRRAASGLESERDNVYSSLTQLKDITASVRSALTTVVDGVTALPDEANDAADEGETECKDDREVSHLYQLSKNARVESVVDRARDQDSSQSSVLFTEVSAAEASSRSCIAEKRGRRFPRPRSSIGWGAPQPGKVT